MKRIVQISSITALFLLSLLPAAGALAAPSIPTYDFKVVRSYPHDPQAFTQGLLYLSLIHI